jgi:hypothetical protein
VTRASNNYAATLADGQRTGELLILPDGRILVHNLTPELARLLSALDPTDAGMRARAGIDEPKE